MKLWLMRTAGLAAALLVIWSWSVGTALAQEKDKDQVTDEQIDAAIKEAVESLWSRQQPDGLWPHQAGKNAEGHWASSTGSLFEFGELMMAALALEHVNTPVDDPRFQKVVKLALEAESKYNYVRSCRVVFLAHLYHRLPAEKRQGLRIAMKADVDYFVGGQLPTGGWRYHNKESNIDYSNTQLVVLALSEAAKCGVEFPRETMERVHRRLLTDQMPDGGWNYGTPELVRSQPSYGSMSAAALASLFLTSEYLFGGMSCPCQSHRSRSSANDAAEALKKGTAWLIQQFSPAKNPGHGGYYYYWLYQAERVGIATGFRYLGTHDWYREGAAALLARQSGGGWGQVPDTSFGILFLAKGRGFILCNKLQFDGDWNLHQYDIANLARYVAVAKEQNILWQVVQAEETPVNLWHDAPMLYISTEGGFNPSEAVKKKLREYTDTGGTLLIEASCGFPVAKKRWEDLAKEIWPEWEFKQVDPTHPVWSADAEMKGARPYMMQMHDGVRSIIFYSPVDISCIWHTNAVAKNMPCFTFGMNLAAYAGDKARLHSNLTGTMIRPGKALGGQKPAAPGAAKLKIGRLKHGGDYYASRNYRGLEMLAAFLKEQAGMEVETVLDVDPGEAEALKSYQVAWLAGASGVNLAESQKAALKAYLAGGGFLVAEGVLGDARFNKAFEELAAALDLKVKPLAVTDDLLTGAIGGATGYDIGSKVKFSRSLALQRIGNDGAALNGLYLKDKLVGVHSPFDVLYSLTGCPAWGRLGYEPDHALAVATNIVLRAAMPAAGKQ